MSIFDELKSSLEEAVEIKQGKKVASRVIRSNTLNACPKKVSKKIKIKGAPPFYYF
jgi:hypothetical protein